MDPTVDYFHLGELTGSGDLAFNLCWRADTFVIFDKTTEHCPTEFIFGRLDHSPGFPTLPGQPGTVVTHNTEFEFSDEPELFANDWQWLAGKDILVTPVLTPNVSMVDGKPAQTACGRRLTGVSFRHTP